MQAHALPVFNKKILLMLRENKSDIPYPNCWGLIGGQAQAEEAPEQCLLRKFEEETMIRPQNYQYMMKWPGKETHLFFVPLTEQEAVRIKCGNEGQALRFFSVEEISFLPLAGTFGREFANYRNLLNDLVESV